LMTRLEKGWDSRHNSKTSSFEEQISTMVAKKQLKLLKSLAKLNSIKHTDAISKYAHSQLGQRLRHMDRQVQKTPDLKKNIEIANFYRTKIEKASSTHRRTVDAAMSASLQKKLMQTEFQFRMPKLREQCVLKASFDEKTAKILDSDH